MSEQKHVVITGANRGIGLALCQHYVNKNFAVTALCREASVALKKLDLAIVTGCDLLNPECFKIVKTALEQKKLDLLLNNAGILSDEQLGQIDYESIERQLLVNAIAPLRLTETLLPQINSNGKIVFITSRMGSISDNTSGGRYGYRMSKAALNMAAVSLAKDVSAQGIAVGIFHPGLVGTDMIGGSGDISPEEAAYRLSLRIDELDRENSGQFFHANGSPLPW